MGKNINVVFGSFPDFSSNAKPLYEYMKKRYRSSMNFSWVVRTDEAYYSLKKSGINVYKFDTDEYYNYIKSVDVIFSTHGDFINDKPEGALYIELWHGIGSKKLGFLSDNLSEFDSLWYSTLKRKIDYVIVPSDFWRVVFAGLFNIEYARVLSLGFPKINSFSDKKCVSKLNNVLNIDVTKFKKVIYYMPTYRNGCNRSDSSINFDNIFFAERYDECLLIDYLRKNNYLLCIKKHPSEELNFPNIISNNIKLITEDMLNKANVTVNEIMNASDLLISDYSSLGIEYMFLNKPIIYLISDINEYNEKRGFIFNNYEFWMPGFRASNINELINSIDNSFNKKVVTSDNYLEKKKLWFDNLCDDGCENICNFLFDGNRISSRVKYYVDYEEKLEIENKYLKEKVSSFECELETKKKYIDSIVNSRGWRILEKMRMLKRKVFRK